jgi:hypothetical protein
MIPITPIKLTCLTKKFAKSPSNSNTEFLLKSISEADALVLQISSRTAQAQ